MTLVNDVDAKDRLNALLDEVEAGGEVVITRDGKPVARLVAAVPPFDRERARRAADGIRRLGSQNSLDGITIRELIDGGRRY